MQAVYLWGVSLSVITFLNCYADAKAVGGTRNPRKVIDDLSSMEMEVKRHKRHHLPNRSPFIRPGEDFVIAPRPPPSPQCPEGYGYSIHRTCVKDLKFKREQHRRIAQGLG